MSEFTQQPEKPWGTTDNQLVCCPPLARGESHLSDYSDDNENEQDLLEEVKRDAERVFNVLMRRAIQSRSLDIDESELRTILGLLDVATDMSSSRTPSEGANTGRYVRKPHSAPASAIIDLRVHPNGKRNTNSLPFPVKRTQSDTTQQLPSKSSSTKRSNAAGLASVTGKQDKSGEPRRGVTILRRIRRALRGLLRQRDMNEAQKNESASMQGEANGRTTTTKSTSSGNELLVPTGFEKQHSNRSHESVSARSTNSAEHHHSVRRGISHSETNTMQRSLVELGSDSTAPRIHHREREKSRKSQTRGLSKVLSDLRTLGAFAKSKREMTDALSTTNSAQSYTGPIKRSDSVSSKVRHRLKTMFSRDKHSRDSEAALADTISKFAEKQRPSTEVESNNNVESINLYGSLQRQKTRSEAIDSIIDCVEHIVEHAEEVIDTGNAPALAEPTASAAPSTITTRQESVKKDKRKKHKKPQAAAIPEVDHGKRLDREIDDALEGACNEVNGMVKAWYATQPERLRQFDEDARQFLSASNYDLFASGMRRASQADRKQKRSAASACVEPQNCLAHSHPHPFSHSRVHAHTYANTDSNANANANMETSLADGHAKQGENGASHGRSQSMPPRPLVTHLETSESEDSQSETGVGLVTLLCLARRTAALGVQTVGAFSNAKRNLLRYFCERYAQFVVDSGGWSALVDDDDCSSAQDSQRNEHPDID